MKSAQNPKKSINTNNCNFLDKIYSDIGGQSEPPIYNKKKVLYDFFRQEIQILTNFVVKNKERSFIGFC